MYDDTERKHKSKFEDLRKNMDMKTICDKKKKKDKVDKTYLFNYHLINFIL